MKIRFWHLMPLALIALIAFAVFVWSDRASFSKRDVVLVIEGPAHIESGQVKIFTLEIVNNSPYTLGDLNLFIDLPSSLSLTDEEGSLRRQLASIVANSSSSIELSLLASVAQSREIMRVRLDYSPQGLDARFVSVASAEITVGNLDVSVIFDMPDVVYPGQEIVGVIHVVPNSDVEISPVYLRLTTPRDFTLTRARPEFDSGAIWRLGTLNKGDDIKREFAGILSVEDESPFFTLELGKFDGIAFFPLKVIERSVGISASPVVLKQTLVRPTGSNVRDGDEVEVRIVYSNQGEVPIEDATLEVRITPTGSIDFSSVSAENALIDELEERIEWNRATTPSLRFLGVGESGEVRFIFEASAGLGSSTLDISNLIINIETEFTSAQSSSFSGASVQVEDILTIKLNTLLELTQSVLRVGNSFSNIGPVPPRVGELTTYGVTWSLVNTLNQVRTVRVEAVLPFWAVWQDLVHPSNEDVQYFAQTNTVVWNAGVLNAGFGDLYPPRSVEFQLGIIPRSEDRGSVINILETTKLTAVDTFTDNFLNQDIGEVDTRLPDDPSMNLTDGIVQ